MKPVIAAVSIIVLVFGLFGFGLYQSSSNEHGQPGYSILAAKNWAAEMGEPEAHVVCRPEYWCHGGIDYEFTNCDVKVAYKIYTIACSAKTGKCNL